MTIRRPRHSKPPYLRKGFPPAFAVDDIRHEYSRLKRLGVVFRGEPTKVGATTVAVFEDTCRNLIQLYQG